MDHFTAIPCRHCGTALVSANQRCTQCGGLARTTQASVTDADFTVSRLLRDARQLQECGELARAITVARQALALRPDCSSIHALLGHLCEQCGDHSAARYHFQAALLVAPAMEKQPDAPPHPAPVPRQALGGWMALLLVGCVVFSGLATLFITFWPTDDAVTRASVRLSTPPSAPHTALDTATTTPRPSSHAPAPLAHEDQTKSVRPITASAHPTATPRVPIPSGRPVAVSVITRATADDAYKAGYYDKAAYLYQELLSRETGPAAELHEALANCHEQMQASEATLFHLRAAISDYQTMANADPDNAEVRAALTRCEQRLALLASTVDRPR